MTDHAEPPRPLTKHPYHLVDPSPWPIVGAIAAGCWPAGGVLFMHGYGWWLLIVAVLGVLGVMAVWWRDVIREAIVGYHTQVVQLGLRYGMLLFIASEVMFFFAFFWAFFSSALFPVGGHLAAQGHPPLQPVRPAVPQHADPAVLGHHRDLGASRAAWKATARA